MNQLSLMMEFERGTKRTVKQVFLEEMLAVLPWDALVALVTPHQSVGSMSTLHALVSSILCKYALSPEEQTMKTQETALKGFPDPSLSIQPVPVESLDLTGRRVVVSGGTDGLGRAIARLAASRGAEVTVVGRTFRDEGVKGLQFVKADLSSMKEAQRVGREMAVESTDVLLLTTGIIPAKQREVTSEGIERDMAVSYLSRLALLQGMAHRLGTARSAATPVPRVFVMGAPGTGRLGNLDDLTGERTYDWMALHMNTVAGNEALVLDGARRSTAVHYFGLNPYLIKTNIRGPVLGGAGGIAHRVVEFFIGLFTQSADGYAKSIVPLLFAKELDDRNGVMFGHKANPILPSKGMTDAYVGRFIDASEQLIENALLR